jgi:sugar lactone lactonase YvrE
MKQFPTITLLSLLVAASASADIPAPSEATIAWIAQGEFCEPETVLPLPDNQLLVSNVCDFRQAGNGFLSLLDAEGRPVDWRIVEGLDAPLGMALHGGRLLVVDNNRLRSFGWPGFEPLQTVELDTSVANDVAVTPDGTVYVSDTAGHRVVELRPDGGQSLFTGAARFPGANGLAFHNGHLYVGGERLWRVNLQNQAVEVVGPPWLADIDGIEFEADGTLQVTPVGGPLVRYWSETEFEILGGAGISSANHGFSRELGLALIPTGFDNQVIAVRVDARPPTAGD